MKIRFLGQVLLRAQRWRHPPAPSTRSSTGNPKAAVEDLGSPEPTHILHHGHADHLGDTVDIAKRTGAQVITEIVELANEIGGNGGRGRWPTRTSAAPSSSPGGWVRLTPA